MSPRVSFQLAAVVALFGFSMALSKDDPESGAQGTVTGIKHACVDKTKGTHSHITLHNPDKFKGNEVIVSAVDSTNTKITFKIKGTPTYSDDKTKMHIQLISTTVRDPTKPRDTNADSGTLTVTYSVCGTNQTPVPVDVNYTFDDEM
ncbi:MAG TPA: hypothetical protein VGP68_18060 [Gemmataceae bacterium]|jgi:hypothetical protein|nr:hypothetical protein [Gemmataceae bacterium]